MKNIQININESLKSREIFQKLVGKLTEHNFNIVSQNADLVISIGGDGTFLKTLKDNDFDDKSLYVGIHTGHLGFLQEINVEDIDLFIQCLCTKKYKIEELKLIKTIVKTSSDSYEYLSLNDVVIREKDFRTFRTEILINNESLELFAGDGVIISTPIGSTAYNLSAGGSIVYPSIHVLQMTPLCAINSCAYRSLQNGVIIPENMLINIIPEKEYMNKTVVGIDGNNFCIDNLKNIEIKMADRSIKVLRFETYNFWNKIKTKFLCN